MTKQKFNIVSYVVYPFDVAIAFNMSYKSLREKLFKLLPSETHVKIELLDGAYDAKTVMFSTGQTVIHFKTIDEGIVAHEVFHAVDFLMERIGCRLAEDSNEAYAYLVQYLTNKIYELKP